MNHWKQKDSRFLVTSGSAYPQLPENQYHVYHGPRGPKGWLGRDYIEAVQHLNAPVIVHEMGQWCVYPNFDELPKYTGPLKPKNFEIFRDSLTEAGLFGQWRDFLRASGRLQVLCYKEEIEAALRTPGLSGVQLLDLHDFPGQGTALVGVLDAFWESKGYVTPAEFRRFCSPTVPLARLTQRAWTTADILACPVEIAHFGAAPITQAAVAWRLVDHRGSTVCDGQLNAPAIGLGVKPVGSIHLNLAGLPAPAAYTLVVTVRDAARPAQDAVHGENDWHLWLYPPTAAEEPPAVLVAHSLDETALNRLDEGGRVLLATDKLSPVHPKLGFEPIFWNRYMFNTQPRQTLGLLCDPRHPALAGFPTEFHQDWQWHDIVTHARGVLLAELPAALRPIVQPIDDWNTNRKLGLLFECRVGSGKLLVCAADLGNNLERRPAARQLRASLLAYAAGDAFDPTVSLSAAQLTNVLHWAARSTLVNLGARVLQADSEDRAHGNTADQAIDGDPDTIWHTEWGAANPGYPHQLTLDLQRDIDLRGLRLLPRQDQQNGWFTGYEIFVSADARAWGDPVARGTWTADAAEKTVQFQSPIRGRYLRLVAREGHQGNPWAAIAELDVVK